MITDITVKDETLIKRLSGHSQFTIKEGVNLLVGPNGSGKSTLLSILLRAPDNKEKVEVKWNRATQFVYFDSEKMNPRVKHGMEDATAYFQVASMFMSHGQTIKPLIIQGLEQNIQKVKPGNDLLVMYDEPESGLDYDAIDEFITKLKEWSLTRDNFQFLIATHSIHLWLQPWVNVIEFVPGYMQRALNGVVKKVL